MHLVIDGYNLLHVGRSRIQLSAADLQRERDRLINLLSSYRRRKPREMTVVFDGWKEGWVTETKERRKGIDLIFSKRGEKADEVIKRIVMERGAEVVVITSDQEVSRFAERMAVSVIPSEKFLEKVEQTTLRSSTEGVGSEEEGGSPKKKGPSRRLSKKERRRRVTLRKL